MSVSPDGSKRMWVYLAAIVSSGTPYCSATEIAIAQALTIPLRVGAFVGDVVEEDLAEVPSSYMPAVM